MSSNVKTAVFWVVIICAVVLVYMAVRTGRGPTPSNLSVSEFVSDIQDGKVKDANITGTDVQGTLLEGGVSRPFHTVIPPNYPDIYKMLQEKNVKYTWKDSTGSGWISYFIQCGAGADSARVVDLHDAADAEWREQGLELR